MKKTIAALVLLTSTTVVQALILEPPATLGKKKAAAPTPQKICLSVASSSDKSQVLGECDESDNNRELKLKLLANGCAAGQAALTTFDSLNIAKCWPPGVVQL